MGFFFRPSLLPHRTSARSHDSRLEIRQRPRARSTLAPRYGCVRAPTVPSPWLCPSDGTLVVIFFPGRYPSSMDPWRPRTPRPGELRPLRDAPRRAATPTAGAPGGRSPDGSRPRRAVFPAATAGEPRSGDGAPAAAPQPATSRRLPPRASVLSLSLRQKLSFVHSGVHIGKIKLG